MQVHYEKISRTKKPAGCGFLRMKVAIASAQTAQQFPSEIARTVVVTISEDSVHKVVDSQLNSAMLLRREVDARPIVRVETPQGRVDFLLVQTQELDEVLRFNPIVRLTPQNTAGPSLGLIGSVSAPEAIKIIFKGLLIAKEAQASVDRPNRNVIQSSIPLLNAISDIRADRVNGVLSGQISNLKSEFRFPAQGYTLPNYGEDPSELARSVVGSIRSLIEAKPMLIPDISAAIPRAIAPDTLPTSVPIPQAIAKELGLKSGQVIEALVSASGGKMALRLNDHSIAVPNHLKLNEGVALLRVLQTQNSGWLLQLDSRQQQSNQALASNYWSGVLVSLLGKSSDRPVLRSLFAPYALESRLSSLGLSAEADFIAANRLKSSKLDSETIKSAIKFGSLFNEKALLEGPILQGGLLKPWLRKLLRLLPHQSNLNGLTHELIDEIESFQLDALPQSNARESGLSCILLFEDQQPVELLFEQVKNTDDESTAWVLNVHTSLEHLGEVWLKSVFSGKNVDLTFWADKQSTAVLARQSKADLEMALADFGLSVQTMQIFASPRPDYRSGSEVGGSIGLDYKA